MFCWKYSFFSGEKNKLKKEEEGKKAMSYLSLSHSRLGLSSGFEVIDETICFEIEKGERKRKNPNPDIILVIRTWEFRIVLRSFLSLSLFHEIAAFVDRYLIRTNVRLMFC